MAAELCIAHVYTFLLLVLVVMLELSLAQILFKNAHIYLFLQERIVRQEKQQQL